MIELGFKILSVHFQMITTYCQTSMLMYLQTFNSRSKNAQTLQKITITENSNDEIEHKMKTILFQSIIVSTYLDYDDYDNPIKTYVDSLDLVNMLVNYTNIYDVKVKQNQAFLADNLIYNSGFDTLTFYNADDREYRVENLEFNHDLSLIVYINLDHKSDEYERTVYSFLDMFGFLGGLFDFMYFTGFLLINFLIKNMYFGDVLSRLYHVEADQKSKQAFHHFDRNFKDTFTSKNQSNDGFHKISCISQMHSEVEINKNEAYNDEINELVENFKKEIKNRRRYSYNISNVFSSCI